MANNMYTFITIYLFSNWPNDTNQIYTELAFRCGSGTASRGQNVTGRGRKKATAKRGLEGIAPCEKARITFSPLVRILT